MELIILLISFCLPGNLVSLFVCTFVAILAVRTTVGGAVWAGPEEKEALESYTLIF